MLVASAEQNCSEMEFTIAGIHHRNNFFQETGGANCNNDEYDCNAKDTNAEDFSNIEEALTDESSRSVKETFTYAIVP